MLSSVLAAAVSRCLRQGDIKKLKLEKIKKTSLKQKYLLLYADIFTNNMKIEKNIIIMYTVI